MAQRHTFPILLILSAAIPAIAQGHPPLSAAAVPEISVTTRDLDLTRTGDVKVLHGRVRRTVESLCANDGARDLESKQAVRDCIDATLADVAHSEARVIAQAERNAAALRDAMALARR